MTPAVSISYLPAARRRLLRAMAVLAIGALLPPVVPASSQELANETTRFEFDQSAGYRLSQITSRSSGKRFLAEAKGPLWELVWHRPDGGELSLDASAKARRSVSLSRHGATQTLHLRWSDMSLGNATAEVLVEIELADGESLARWWIETTWDDESLILWDVHFPRIGGIARGGADDMLVMPMHWGRYCRDPIERLQSYRMVYPCSAGMQLWAFLSGGSGLYMATHDGDGWYKGWNWRADGRSATGRWETFHAAPLPTPTPQRYRLPYPCVIGTFEGTWHKAAAIYRRWALKQSWCAEGPIAARDSIPEPLKRSACWLKYYFEPGKVLHELWDHQQYLRVPMAVHYYRYPVSRFDDNYPEFLPAKPGFLRGVADMQRLGAQVVPYTQGSIWDTDTQSWRLEGGFEAAAKQQDGSLYEWPIHENIHAWMCPATETWQNKVFDFTSKLVWDHGVDGVYLDVLSAGRARPCYDPDHGHPIHGGNYWGQGNRRLVDSLRKRVRARKPDAVFTTEEICEIYLDKFDAFLTLDVTRGGYIPPVMLLPLFTAVYHDYAIQYGSDCALSSDPELFCPLLAEHFVWGAKLTLSEIRPPEIGQSPVSAAYLRELARCYDSVGRKFLLEGQWLQPPELDVPERLVHLVRKRKVDVPMPVVRRSLWRAPDGSVGLVMTNWTADAVPVGVQLDPVELGFESKVFVQTLWPAGDDKARQVEGPVRLNLDLPPHSARLWQLSAERPGPPPRPSYDEPLPYLCLRRGDDGAFNTAEVRPGSLGYAAGAVVSITADGALQVEKVRSQDDFVLLRRHEARLAEPAAVWIDSCDPSALKLSVRSGPLALEIPPGHHLIARNGSGNVPVRHSGRRADIALGDSGGRVWITRPTADDKPLAEALRCSVATLAEASRKAAARSSALSGPEAELPAREAAIAEQGAVSAAVAATCGVRLEIVAPPRARLLPLEPLEFGVRLRRDGSRESITWNSVDVEAIVDGHRDELRLENVERRPSGTLEKSQGAVTVQRGRLVAADRRLAEHAVLLRAECELEFEGHTMVLTDTRRLPIDHPLLIDLVERRIALVGGRSRKARLRIRNVAPRPLEIHTKGLPPAGWRVEPTEGIKLLIPAAGDAPGEATIELTVTAAENAAQGQVDVPFSTVYEGHQAAERIDLLHCQVVPSLVPLDPAEKSFAVAEPLPRIRRASHAMVFVEGGREAEITIEQLPVSQYRESTEYRILDPDLEPVASGKIGLGKRKTFRLATDEAGSFVVELEPGTGSCVLRTDHRWLVWEASPQQPLTVINDNPPQYFFVPPAAKQFSLVVQSGGPTETSRQTVWRPDGTVVLDEEGAYESRRFQIAVPQGAAGKVWKLHVDPRQDVKFHLEGDVVPFVADDPARLLVPR